MDSVLYTELRVKKSVLYILPEMLALPYIIYIYISVLLVDRFAIDVHAMYVLL